MSAKFAILKPTWFGRFKIVAKSLTRKGVMAWHEKSKDDSALVVKADDIRSFIKKSE